MHCVEGKTVLIRGVGAVATVKSRGRRVRSSRVSCVIEWHRVALSLTHQSLRGLNAGVADVVGVVTGAGYKGNCKGLGV
jgi:hypothetical protein